MAYGALLCVAASIGLLVTGVFRGQGSTLLVVLSLVADVAAGILVVLALRRRRLRYLPSERGPSG